MIYDNLANLSSYEKLNPHFNTAINFINKSQSIFLENGKHYIDKENVIAIINNYETKKKNDLILEGHKKYIDLHFLKEGTELIEFETFKNQPVVKNYSKEDDYGLYNSSNPIKLKLTIGKFIMFFPNDLHYPGIAENEPKSVKKIVLKIRTESI